MGAAALRQENADPESGLRHDEHEALRLWLRLFTCTTMVERVVDSTLKREFGSSLPRFDLLAQLHRATTASATSFLIITLNIFR